MAVDEGKVKSASTLTYQQKKKLQNREITDDHQYPARVLDPPLVEETRKESERRVAQEAVSRARKYWLGKLEAGDYSGPELDRSRYLSLRNSEVKGILGRQRNTEKCAATRSE